MKAEIFLTTLKPTTIAQASRIPGFTPTATLLLLRHLKRDNKEKKINEN
jgi:tRNA U34 5-carboxymethylaminomethyl modifying enzyme MnmG/GidA